MFPWIPLFPAIGLTNRSNNFQALYPPRDVKDFRVVIARDASTDRKPANRTAQITVWNVMSLIHEEGGERGNFKAGQTFLVRRIHTRSLKRKLSGPHQVSNLLPNQPGSWMDPSPTADGVVYLATGKRTSWTLCRR